MHQGDQVPGIWVPTETSEIQQKRLPTRYEVLQGLRLQRVGADWPI